MLTHIQETVIASVVRATQSSEFDDSNITTELARKANSGDIATNAAMIVAKQLGLDPIDLANRMVPDLETYYGKGSCVVAGPGFINITLPAKSWYNHLYTIMFLGSKYGDGELSPNASRSPINFEYVSANPTGPLHIGHARGAILGDTLAALFEKSGFDVVREYYVNDAGGQIEVLLDSVRYRHHEMNKQKIKKPEDFYPGDYIIDIAKAWDDYLFDKGELLDERLLDKGDAFREFVLDGMMKLIKDGLSSLGINHDEFVYESNILDNGGLTDMLQKLRRGGHTYKGTLPPPKGKEAEADDYKHLLFKSTNFGDDVDRPLKKKDGSWTYFATDIAYHMDKYNRGHNGSNSMINIWGADHAGYVARVKAALHALTKQDDILHVELCQMVSLIDAGVSVKMSKRDNNFVLVSEVIDRVGLDALRFTMLTRKCDSQLTFDFQKAIEQSKDNMVYYVQYAHARACSVIEKAEDKPEHEDVTNKGLARLSDPSEMALIKHMVMWPNMVMKATYALEPHRVAFYLYELAGLFHSLWNKGKQDVSLRFLIEDDEELSMARLILVQCVMHVIKSGLDVMGVSSPENM